MNSDEGQARRWCGRASRCRVQLLRPTPCWKCEPTGPCCCWTLWA